MRAFLAKFKFFAIVFFFISVVIVYLFYDALKPKETLTIYQPSMVNSELVDSTIQNIRKYHTIADFSLINQNGKTITQKDYDGKIYIADFFFTTCPTICPIMTENMAIIQRKIQNDSTVKLLSHTVTPEIDSVTQLKKYAVEKGVDDRIWNLVTGDKKQIYDLARKSYLAVQTVGDGGPFDMIHTENFILVDKQKRIRGFYDGTKPEEIDKLMDDLEVLKAVYAKQSEQ
ncbi:SCO family protein [Aurantibacter crassamenti]|uniref:SCO family protein n=1 Tax=Aurantibacter crassamenti TaxID=1837375 RepID=UPI00193A89C3|nr:SCO family protein [Aurantibacter crassamenti]MBM1105459.1 SCO family protein [Aurantibacter crassamenti]